MWQTKKGIDAVLELIKEQFGDIDILVNNAGITRDNLLMAYERMKNGLILCKPT